jgi:hypothetical protein
MKKHVIIATGAALLSTSAFATKARMAALGQDENRGSQYIQDSRNVFRNAAHVNSMNNYIVTEWGSHSGGAEPQVEGGFFRSTGNLSYGMYFGGERDSGLRAVRADGSGTDAVSGVYKPGNELELFVGGDAGFQWGARLAYISGKDERGVGQANSGGPFAQHDNTKRNGFGLGLGAIFGDTNAYANLSLANKSELTDATNDNVTVKGKLGLNLGVAHNWNNLTFHADFVTNKAERSIQNNTVTGEYSVTNFTVGVAQTHEISSTAMVFFAADYSNTKLENSNMVTASAGAAQTPTTANSAEIKSNALSATFGFETDATSWLTWRGSLTQNVLVGNSKFSVTPANVALNGKKVNADNTTEVAAGASLTFGKLVVDGTLGTVTTAKLNANEFFSNVAVSYWF